MHRLARAVKDRAATVVRMEIFGALQVRAESLGILKHELGGLDWPVTYVEGASCEKGMLSGAHVLAVTGSPVESVKLDGRVVGRTFKDKWARHLLLGEIMSKDVSRSREEQARLAFEEIEAGTRVVGMSFANVARTWFFLDDILSWYIPFNTVRTDFFRERGVFDRLVPASTGVSGRNIGAGAVMAGAWASEPLNGAFTMCEVASPRQCPAPKYGSSFSRAAELGTPDLCRLMVSGTASIAPAGESVCPNDIEAQIELTMEVIRAILVSRGMDFADGSRVTAYFKRPDFVPAFEQWRAKNDLAEWPIVYTQADICRDELLFELEMDALAPPHPVA